MKIPSGFIEMTKLELKLIKSGFIKKDSFGKLFKKSKKTIDVRSTII